MIAPSPDPPGCELVPRRAKALLRARIVAARRAHDTAIRALDLGWKQLLADLEAGPAADHGAIVREAEDRLAPVLAIAGEQPSPRRRINAR